MTNLYESLLSRARTPGMSSTDGLHVRCLYAAPDDPTQILATCDRGVIPLLHVTRPADGAPSVDLVADTDDTPRVRLPFPATDLCWCPFKNGAENASFLSSCQSQPLQLWDLDDGCVRASYVAHNDSGMNAHPRAALWLSNPFQSLVAGAYGGVEDSTQVRFFDIAVEGNQAVYGYRSPATKGPISALGQCAPLPSNWSVPTSRLVLAGFLHHDQVDCIDYRQQCAAAILRGPTEGGGHSVTCVRTSPLLPHLVFASGRGGTGSQGDVLCWDLRRPCSVLAQFSRPVKTQQRCDFALVPAAHSGSNGVRLVSATTDSGVLVFDAVGAAGRVSGRLLHSGIGITSGLAAVSATEVAVAVGAREYRFAHSMDAVASPRQDLNAGGHPEEAVSDEEAGSEAVPHVLRLKRTRSLAALTESDDDEQGDATGQDALPNGALNVQVLSIAETGA